THQFEQNAPYRAFCERRGVTPATVARWEDVPAVPSAAFRRVELACGPPEAVFRTSGTSGAGARGRHLVPCLALYRASALATFAPFVLPDAARLPCLCLAPPPALRPESSLVQMCVWVGEGLASGIEWMIGERGLETERLLARLAAAEASGEALLLLGVLAAVAPGATGLLCHHDLANAGSVSVVLSEDLGRAVGDDGIEVLGRVAGAAPRGCGLLLADLEAP